MTRKFLKLLIAIAVSELAGVIGSLFTIPAINGWYATLQKPALNPPAWIFGPVWTTLFALMGIALFLVWKRHTNILEDVGMSRLRKIGVALFSVQLILNTLWSIIFFGLHSPRWAFADIIFLWLAILATIFAFAKISPPSSSIWTTAGHGKLAAWLLVPYILWVSFAGYLNYSIWQLNSNQTPNISLPQGYTLDSYSVEKVSEISCVRSSECETPGEYLVQSRCPFTSMCLNNKCAVVCPDYVR